MRQEPGESTKRVARVFVGGMALLLLVHLFGAAGLAIQETTKLIEYGRIVTAHEYFEGLTKVVPVPLFVRLSPWFFVRIGLLGALLYMGVLRSEVRLSRRMTVGLLWVVALGQLLVMPAPLYGLACMLWSGDLIHGIDGELFGEDWVSWAASDLLFLGSVVLVILIARTYRAGTSVENRAAAGDGSRGGAEG